MVSHRAENRFYTPAHWMENPISIVLGGVGGTGGEVIDGLVRIHFAMRGLGHPSGLHVTVFDPDTVSPANIGRQRFVTSDIGMHKSIALVHRLNLAYGLNWEALPVALEPDRLPNDTDLLITCVDRAATRVAIGDHFRDCDTYGRQRSMLWLDCGNGASDGQCCLGHLYGFETTPGEMRLPNVLELFTELRGLKDDTTPSCSLAQALRHQDLLVNRLVADAALAMLWQLFRHGSINHHGAFVDVAKGVVQPLLIDPITWCFLSGRNDAAR